MGRAGDARQPGRPAGRRGRPEGYATWVTAAPLPADVKDVGTRQEPSVDSIVALQPDLVVMEAERDAPLVAQLEKYVPVIVTKGSDATDNLGRLRTDLTMIAQATGTTDKATALLAELDKAIADGKAKIAAAGNAGKGYAMADGWKQGSAISIRMFGQGALVSQLAISLGLTNAWKGEVDPAWGLGTTDVEGVLALKDADLTFFYNASDGDDVFADGLAGNKIWESLTFVKNKQVTKLPNGIWTFGGPKSCIQYINELVKAYGA
ncbi:ABC transporter substrate-binding protein [Luedemannella flava]